MSLPATLSVREETVLVSLGRFRFMTTKQIERLIFLGQRKSESTRVVTGRLLRHLRQRALIENTERILGGPRGGSTVFSYYLTERGIRVLRRHGQVLPRKAVPRGTFLLRHSSVLVDTYLTFLEASVSHRGHELSEWLTEWEASQRLSPHKLVPDGYLVYVTGSVELHSFLEADLGASGTGHFKKKLRRYLDYFRSGEWKGQLGLWPVVLTITTSTGRAEHLRAATETVIESQHDAMVLKANTEFSFTSLSDVSELGPLGAIWQTVFRPERLTLTEQGRKPR